MMELNLSELEQINHIVERTKNTDRSKSLAEILDTTGSVKFHLLDDVAVVSRESDWPLEPKGFRVSTLYYDTFNHKVALSIHK
jgi:hypothetical protein